MPVTITVSEVRQALYHAAGAQSASGDGAPSLAVLGTWFHEAVGWLVDDSGTDCPFAVLADVDEDLQVWKQTLVERAYSQFVGPRLCSHQAALQDVAPQVLTFWQAMQAVCHWLAELAWSVRPPRASRAGSRPAPWLTLAEWLTTEEPLSCDLREPGWVDSVRLVGVADAVVRLADAVTPSLTHRVGVTNPKRERGSQRGNAWCAIEFKLGQTSPAADLG